MTWTYTSSDLPTSQLFQVRFEVGDVISNDQQLQDEEINYVLTVEPSVQTAGARCCEELARRYARKVDYHAGKLSISNSQKSKAYAALAKDLRQRSLLSAGGYLGGMSISDKVTENEQSDRVQPAFFRGMTDNQDASSQLPSVEGEDSND